MYAIAEKQVLIGVCFDGMQKLNKPRQVQTLFTKQGVRSCIFKGQANLPFYPSELSSLRQSGDIDI